jgi:hypothetical protein
MAFRTSGKIVIGDNRNAIETNMAIPTTGGVHVVTGSAPTPVPSSPPMAGTNTGFVSGGFEFTGFGQGASTFLVQSFPFSNENFGAIHTNLDSHLNASSGHSSETHGFVTGGTNEITGPLSSEAFYLRAIQKFGFAAPVATNSIGNLSAGRYYSAGHSSTSDGFVSGGIYAQGAYIAPNGNIQFGVPVSSVEKFPFFSDGSSSFIGNLNGGYSAGAGNSSLTHGFNCFGRIFNPTITLNSIEKFNFSSVFSASDVGDLASLISYGNGISSTTNGYVTGGYVESPSSPVPTVTLTNTILKYPFASGGTAASIGTLGVSLIGAAGVSSTGFGYSIGGTDVSLNPSFSRIEKFPFASDSSGSYIADLNFAYEFLAGQQD